MFGEAQAEVGGKMRRAAGDEGAGASRRQEVWIERREKHLILKGKILNAEYQITCESHNPFVLIIHLSAPLSPHLSIRTHYSQLPTATHLSSNGFF